MNCDLHCTIPNFITINLCKASSTAWNGSTNCWPWQILLDVASPLCQFHVADGILLDRWKVLFVTGKISNIVDAVQNHCGPAMSEKNSGLIQNLTTWIHSDSYRYVNTWVCTSNIYIYIYVIAYMWYIRERISPMRDPIRSPIDFPRHSGISDLNMPKLSIYLGRVPSLAP